MNNTHHKGIDNIPSVLLFSLCQRGQVTDLLREYLANYQQRPNRNSPEIRQAAEDRVELEETQNKLYFDKRHKKPHVYRVDDFVMVSNVNTRVGVNKKFIPKFKGPYVFTKILPNDRYVVEDIQGFQLTQMSYRSTLEPSRLQLWLDPDFGSH